jgi:monooxygenase
MDARRSGALLASEVSALPLAARTEQVDVLIVGAGISGIGAAYYLQERRPGTTYAIVEARAALGGTWDLFKYPGLRSDSDLYTFGYSFKPWRSRKAIASGAEILAYLRDTAADHGIDRHIRYCR